MRDILSGKQNPIGKKLSDSRGMTMGELLVVVAIVVILSGVAFISVINHQRTLAQLERDGIAKEIFVAAQNHLTMAKGENYLGVGKDSYGLDGTIKEGITNDKKKDEKGVYYYVVNEGNAGTAAAIFNQTLPFGAIEENVRGGGSYLIRYQPETGLVLDVFYCSTGDRFGHTLDSDEYTDLMSTSKYYGDDKKEARKEYPTDDGKAIVGWYGNSKAGELRTAKLNPPKIKVVNEEILYVEITKDDGETIPAGTSGYSQYGIRLLLSGRTTGAEHYIDIQGQNGQVARDKDGNPVAAVDGDKYTFVLDDITKDPKEHFANKKFYQLKTDDGPVNEFIPGEDITVQAVAYTNTDLSNVARSEQKVTNSLYAGIEDKTGNDKPDVAYISNIRHLENLDQTVSKYMNNQETGERKIDIGTAIQTADLVWNKEAPEGSKGGFLQEISKHNNVNLNEICISYGQGGQDPEGTSAGCYKPVVFEGITYDGKGHSVKTLKVNSSSGNAGMFDSASSNTTIKNLELIDFDIAGVNSGALAGTLLNSTVSNVIARNTSDKIESTKISGTYAGGLVGVMKGGTAKYSAASVIVNGTSNAGGLIGKAETPKDGKPSLISHCYSGGHTKNGSYNEWVKMQGHSYDVTGDIAGGLIGAAGSSTIEQSYSTCSVSGSTNAGGFVGTATVGIAENVVESPAQEEEQNPPEEDNTKVSISDCYCTGLVKLKTQTSTNTAEGANPNSGMGAFAGSLETSSGAQVPTEQDVKPRNCGCLEIINEVTKGDDADVAGTYERYLYPVGDKSGENDQNALWGIQAIDGDTASYENFVKGPESWNPAKMYDKKQQGSDKPALDTYYDDKYTFRTVDQLPATNTKVKTSAPSSFADNYHRFVITHYGDWPAPEIFIINSAS